MHASDSELVSTPREFSEEVCKVYLKLEYNLN